MRNKTIKKFTFNTIFILGFVVFSFFVFPQTAKASLNTDYVELIVTYSYPNGTACSTDDECDSNHCIDGYCCDTTCTTTCMACNLAGNLGTCTNIPEDTDPDSECSSDCASGCEDRTGDCDGAAACKTTYCSAGHSCSGTACGDANYCNATLAYCSGQGDGFYNDGGNSYQCQGSCDGSNNCDYADNCSVVSSFDNSFKFGGNLQMSDITFDFEMDPPDPCAGTTIDNCSCTGSSYCTLNVSGDTVYVDCNADKCWTPTAGSKYAWGGLGIDEPSDSCVGIASRPACNYCDNLINYGGKSDWVLPDRTILLNLCNSGSCSQTCFGGDGDAGGYWSSTENSSIYAYRGRFDICTDQYNNKTSVFRVRCMR